ncbi:EamA family transporter [Pseudoroseomonas wenyumeiae]
MAGVVALITFTTAVRHLGAARTSAITALTPATVVAVAVLLLGEVPGWPELLGCVLIIAGVVAASGAWLRAAGRAEAQTAPGRKAAPRQNCASAVAVRPAIGLSCMPLWFERGNLRS